MAVRQRVDYTGRVHGVIARFVRRITLRSLAASSAKRGVSWDSGSTDGRWRAPRPRSSSRSRRSTRYVPIPTARRAGAGSGPASITPDPVTACASFASTGSDAHSRSCSKPSTASKPTAFTWSASRSVSTPRRRPASSCSTSSAGPLLTLIQRCVRDRAVTPLYDETKSRPPAACILDDGLAASSAPSPASGGALEELAPRPRAGVHDIA